MHQFSSILVAISVLDSLSYGCEDNEDVMDEFLTALRDGRDVGDDASKANGASIEPAVVQAVFAHRDARILACRDLSRRRAGSGRSRKGREEL